MRRLSILRRGGRTFHPVLPPYIERGVMRTLRVFHPDGDFYITIPDDARVTFGYFNPASAQPQPQWRVNDNAWMLMRRTALRVYADSTDKRQMACYLGATGFRDITIKQRTVRSRGPVLQPAPPRSVDELEEIAVDDQRTF